VRAVIQRVSKAAVSVNKVVVGSINLGFFVLLGIEQDDTLQDATWIAKKIAAMRIFGDDKGLMNKSLSEVNGSILLVSQFTLHASTKKGNRPSFIKAAKPEQAIPLYKEVKNLLLQEGVDSIQEGVFGAMMEVSLVNDGPVTIIIDTKNKE